MRSVRRGSLIDRKCQTHKSTRNEIDKDGKKSHGHWKKFFPGESGKNLELFTTRNTNNGLADAVKEKTEKFVVEL